MENENILFRLENLSRVFGAGFALKDLNLSIESPQIVGLIGLNRSGKSALASLLGGVSAGYTGKVYVQGYKVNLRSPADAQRAGIVVVTRENFLFPEMSVAENLFFEESEKDGPFLHMKKYREKTWEVFETLGIDIDASTPVKNLSRAENALLSVAKAYLRDPRVLVFDDIAADMTPREASILQKVVQRLRENGRAVILISHDLRQIAALCDKVVVMKEGAFSHELTDTAYEKLVEALLGTEFGSIYPPKPLPRDEEVMRVEKLTGKGFADISFTVRKGEIVGLAGLDGSGRDQILRGLAGLTPCKGEVSVEGESFQISSPADPMARGIVTVTDTKDELYCLKFEKLARQIADTGKAGGAKRRMIQFQDSLETFGGAFGTIFSFKKPKGEKDTALQKKLDSLNRAFAKEAKVYLMHLPTAPLDVVASTRFYNDMARECEDGVSFVITSNDLDELCAVCNTVVALKNGRVVQVLTGDHVTKNNINNLVE
ncbi:sugar ABC transporter ATP-binding protein [Oscillospiraceae bacterium NSJ-54]|uniref:Sugar ABC transporter ATP-binding protein n=1 Tax=Zongyangia hominis TaxID=2763677 RepID=A0A926IBL9_9FIRM|nr:sugar ABC transporter ATP-binding protein [Zongyangia hominis]